MKAEASSLLGFVSEIVSSLAWPVTLLTCVLLLKRHLVALIPLVRTVKYSDVEIRFGQEVAQLKKSADTADLPEAKASFRHGQWEALVRLAEVRPRTAIRSAWGHIETSIRELAKRRNTELTDAAEGMPMVIGAILLNQGAMSSEQYVLMQKLRMLLHEAERADAGSITTDSAVEYVALALRLAASLVEKEGLARP
jgi:hypothetical protein